MTRFLAGCFAGIGIAALFAPRLIRNIVEENRIISDNGHIERNRKTFATITKNKLTNDDHSNRYPDNT